MRDFTQKQARSRSPFQQVQHRLAPAGAHVQGMGARRLLQARPGPATILPEAHREAPLLTPRQAGREWPQISDDDSYRQACRCFLTSH